MSNIFIPTFKHPYILTNTYNIIETLIHNLSAMTGIMHLYSIMLMYVQTQVLNYKKFKAIEVKINILVHTHFF